MPLSAFEGLKVEEAPKDAVPTCPACHEDLPTIWVKPKEGGVYERQQILMCPNCKAFLGYGCLTR